MNISPALYTKQYRLAQHYLGRLRSASHAYQRGDENTLYGLKLAQQEWPQIQQWQTWTAAQVGQQREAAALCSAYSLDAGELLDLMLTPQEQRTWCETGLTAARQEADPQAELGHLLTLGQLYIRLADYPHAVSAVQQAMELARQADDRSNVAQGLAILGQIALIEGKFADAQAYREQSLSLYRAFQDQAGIARNLFGLGTIMSDLRRPAAARAYTEEALHIFRLLGNTRGIASALKLLGSSWLEEDFERAGKYYDECLPLLKQLNIQRDLLEIYAPLSTVLAYRGEFDQAEKILEEGLRLARQLQLPGQTSNFLGNLAVTADMRGNLEAARAYYEQSVAVARQFGRFWEVGSSLLVLNSLAVRQRDYPAALSYAVETLAFERNHDHPEFLAQSLLQVAFAHIALGNIEFALSPLREIGAMIQATHSPDLSLGLIACKSFLSLKTGRTEGGAEHFGLIDQRKYPGYWIYYIRLVREELRAALGTEAFAAVLERGKTLDFEATVAEVIAELQE